MLPKYHLGGVMLSGPEVLRIVKHARELWPLIESDQLSFGAADKIIRDNKLNEFLLRLLKTTSR
jgi:hypothetical protein